MDKKPPQYSERYIEDSESFVKGQNEPVIKGQNEPVIKGQNEPVSKGQHEPVLRLRGGGDPEPGSVWQLVRI